MSEDTLLQEGYVCKGEVCPPEIDEYIQNFQPDNTEEINIYTEEEITPDTNFSRDILTTVHSTWLSAADSMLVGTSKLLRIGVGAVGTAPSAIMDFYLEKDEEGDLKATITSILSAAPGVAAIALTPVGIGIGTATAIGFGVGLLSVGLDWVLDTKTPNNWENGFSLFKDKKGNTCLKSEEETIPSGIIEYAGQNDLNVETPTETYKVMPGDSLYGILSKLGLEQTEDNLVRFLAENPDLLDRMSSDLSFGLIKPGEVLEIPPEWKDDWFNLPGSADPFMGGVNNNFSTAEGQPLAFDPDPMILDLDGDGIETTTLEKGVYFDHDSNGFAEASSWAGTDDGLLATDLNNDGTINDGSELIQNFGALAGFDTNTDGVIDSSDTDYANLQVLRGDGTTQTLADAGIQSIDLSHTNVNTTDASGNTQLSTGTFAKSDGTQLAA